MLTMNQPLTSTQLNRKTGIPGDTCSYILAECQARGICLCLNAEASSSRLYYLTKLGLKLRQRLTGNHGTDQVDLDSVDWDLYSWACFRHRSAVVKTLTELMPPPMIRKHLMLKNTNLKISRNNITDILKLLHEKGLIEKVFIKKRKHPWYKPTEQAQQIRKLLLSAEVPFCER